jgi:DNA ligase-1
MTIASVADCIVVGEPVLTALPTLYALSKTGKLKQWNITSHCDEKWDATNVVVHGYVDGKKQTDVKAIKGKNIGKSNETTPYMQAIKDALALWKKKIDKGYGEDPGALVDYSEMRYQLPMLAHDFKKRGKSIIFPAWAQPKFDGIRCIAAKRDGVIEMWSRAGKVFTFLHELAAELQETLSEGDYVDGELYVHGWSMQRVARAVKKRRDAPGNDDTTKLEYHIYDRPGLTTGLEDRFNNDKTMAKILEADGLCKICPTYFVGSPEDLGNFEAGFIREGYEGAMIRNRNGIYKWKHRSIDLQKVKRFEDDEFIIVGGEEGVGRATGQVKFLCETADGKEFGVRPVGENSVRENMWEKLDQLIGCHLTVKYQGLTDDGIPRFPVGKSIRENWDTS